LFDNIKDLKKSEAVKESFCLHGEKLKKECITMADKKDQE
jgi:hypothetical protein